MFSVLRGETRTTVSRDVSSVCKQVVYEVPGLADVGTYVQSWRGKPGGEIVCRVDRVTWSEMGSKDER